MIEPSMPRSDGALVGVDVGGTFTDAVVVVGDRLVTAKRPTTPDDQSLGVIEAVGAALDAAGIVPSDVSSFAHGMTVGTNALLEGRGARAALVATEGFGDVLELRRQTRASLYDLAARHPDPLIPHERVVEAAERVGAEGVLTPLTDDAVADVVDRVRTMDVESVAIGLLFSFAEPEHERRIALALSEALPAVHVSASHEVLPEIREYERISTTAVDAYLNPVLRSYLERLGGRAREAALPAPAIMQSSGGLLPLEESSDRAAWTVLSGPAGGVIGAAALARAHGVERALTFDMGGTSCDVALIEDGRPARTSGTTIAGHPIHLSLLDIETVSAGGGSVGWADSGGALRVGPRSAGARPGPAAYGHGGSEATVTDANVALGRLEAGMTLGETIALDGDAAADAVHRLAGRLGLDGHACAGGILTVANQEMVRALRRVSVERGVDPRECTLIAFGGAGPLHAADVADELGMRRVICPPAAGVLAALGLVVAGERRDYVQTVLRGADEHGTLLDEDRRLRERAAADVPGGTVEAAGDCRYRGQTHTLTVPWDPEGDPAALARDFHAAHAQRFGDSDPSREVEVVNLRVAVEREGPRPPLSAAGEDATLTGPAALPMDGATCWVAEGWTARVDSAGAVHLEREPSWTR